MLTDEPEGDIIKYVLRGKHPTEEWWPTFEMWWKGLLKWQRKLDRILLASAKRELDSTLLLENPWLSEWTKLYKRQLAAMKRAAKKEGLTK